MFWKKNGGKSILSKHTIERRRKGRTTVIAFQKLSNQQSMGS